MSPKTYPCILSGSFVVSEDGSAVLYVRYPLGSNGGGKAVVRVFRPEMVAETIDRLNLEKKPRVYSVGETVKFRTPASPVPRSSEIEEIGYDSDGNPSCYLVQLAHGSRYILYPNWIVEE